VTVAQQKAKLVIDGLEVEVDAEMSIMEVARVNGIYIPHLCYHPDLEPVGACRMCMVDVGGHMVASCMTPATDGIAVTTSTPQIDSVRRNATELLLTDHPLVCHDCTANNDCTLQTLAAHVGVTPESMARLRRVHQERPVDDSNPFFTFDPNKCVLCGICVRTCDEIVGANAIDFSRRGFDSQISPFGGSPFIESVCESCGECVVRCPVGALSPKRFGRPSREVQTICGYCGVGCGLYLGVKGDQIVSARGVPHSPVSAGSLCVKGRFGHRFINHPDRLTTPLVKHDGHFVEASWDEALNLVAERLSGYSGPEFATIASAKCTNEENYLLGKFTRAGMGTNNLDHCARLCHAPSVAGLAQTFGSGAMTNSIAEIRHARCIFAIGTNTTAAHPIIGNGMRQAARDGALLIVANPREIGLARKASLYLRHNPGSDVALLMGMLRVIVDEDLYDEAFVEARTEGFETLRASLADFDLDTVERLTGVDRTLIAEAARTFATTRPAAIFFAMGITQHTHGTDNVIAISNLALLTGSIGAPSTGVNPLRGQNNVQGACDMGSLPNVYPGYQKVDVPEVKAKFEAAWNTTLDASPGLTHLELTEAIHAGQVKAVYLVGENPVLSEADAGNVEQALEKLEFMVVQDIFMTETARLADVVLPAVTFAEKDGTFTNTERRIQRVRMAIEPVGDAKPDWWITSQIARRMGFAGFEFSHPREIMSEIASVNPSYAGVRYERLEAGGLQWPVPDADHPGTRFLHEGRFATPSGKANILPLVYRPPDEQPDEDYPLVLTTERSLYHFHTATMTRKVEGLRVLRSHELLELNPADASRFGIDDGDLVRVASRRGEVEAEARVTTVSPPGVVSMTFHFEESRTNLLTNPARDPVAKIPETKVCAVRVRNTNRKVGDPAVTLAVQPSRGR
jgi:formate dehydrogenase alpha subunit